MNRSRIALALAALAAGVGAAWLIASSDLPDSGTAEAAFTAAVGWSLVGSGLIALHQGVARRLGRVLVATGFAWFAASLSFAPDDLLFTLGTMLESVWVLGVAYFLLAFPAGRLGSAVERALVAAGIVVVGPLQIAWMLFGDGDEDPCASCPANLVEVAHHPDLSLAITRTQQGIAAVVTAASLVVLARRWERSSGRLRHAIAPVFWAALATIAALLVWVVNDALGEPLGDAPDIAVYLLLVGLPAAFLVGLLRSRLARARVADLVVELGRAVAPGRLRDALARALRDPSLTVAYAVPGAAGFVDLEGRPVDLPGPGGARAATMVERDGTTVAALVHDPALLADRQLLDSAAAAAALALENERLQAELRARLADLRDSRARIVQAAGEERRRIERNLHDGTQQRLVSIAMTLGLAESRLGDPEAARPLVREAREGLSAALAELRELSQGIHPGMLAERGLGAALEDLVYRARLPIELEVSLGERLDEPVEAAAYYVVSESLANVAKHARATAASVRVERRDGRAVIEVADDGVGGAERAAEGSGLRGLADRVEALGGRLSLASPPGRGTVVRAEIPCG